MPEQDKLLKELGEARDRYYKLLAKLIELGVPGIIDVIDKVAAKCDVGEVCHGGTFRKPTDLIRPPDAERPQSKG